MKPDYFIYTLLLASSYSRPESTYSKMVAPGFPPIGLKVSKVGQVKVSPKNEATNSTMAKSVSSKSTHITSLLKPTSTLHTLNPSHIASAHTISPTSGQGKETPKPRLKQASNQTSPKAHRAASPTAYPITPKSSSGNPPVLSESQVNASLPPIVGALPSSEGRKFKCKRKSSAPLIAPETKQANTSPSQSIVSLQAASTNIPAGIPGRVQNINDPIVQEIKKKLGKNGQKLDFSGFFHSCIKADPNFDMNAFVTQLMTLQVPASFNVPGSTDQMLTALKAGGIKSVTPQLLNDLIKSIGGSLDLNTLLQIWASVGHTLANVGASPALATKVLANLKL